MDKKFLILLIFISFFASFAHASKVTSPRYSPATHLLLKKKPLHANTTSKVLDHFRQWKGVRYRFGGNGRNGIDCSAYTQKLFRQEFAIALPRTTGEQIRKGRKITRTKLRSGDLIFFQIKPGDHHVGVYAGNNRFIHASTSRGVMISSMENPYWMKRFMAARRLLPENQA